VFVPFEGTIAPALAHGAASRAGAHSAFGRLAAAARARRGRAAAASRARAVFSPAAKTRPSF